MKAMKVFGMFCILVLTVSPALAVDWTVGLGDYWGDFSLNFQNYKVKFDSEGLGLLGFFTEIRMVNNKLGVGLNYVTGKYSFEGSGTTGSDEELEADGTRKRRDLDFWVRYAPHRHFSVFLGYKQLAFDFNEVNVRWNAPESQEGKILEGTADADMSGLALGLQTAFGRRVVTVLSLSYYPSLSGDVTWDGYTQKPGEEKKPDSGSSTVVTQGFKFQLNVVKPFPQIRSAVTVGYFLQVITDELDSINYRTDELFTGIMFAFNYTFRFSGSSGVSQESSHSESDLSFARSPILSSFHTDYN